MLGCVIKNKAECLEMAPKTPDLFVKALLVLNDSTTDQHFKMFAEQCRKSGTFTNKAALVVVEHLDEILYFTRADNGQVAFPCGGVDGSETFREAAIRELREEAGITLQTTEQPVCYGLMKSSETTAVAVFHVKLDPARGKFVPQPEKEFAHEGTPFFGPKGQVGGVTDRFFNFNNLLIHNMGILDK